MTKAFFKFLARINKRVLPGYYRKDPAKLSKLQKAITGYRYWVLMRALD
ncbi:hypothetical protein [Pedobacter sp. SYP-B3415]|nr:hypothetical protein [Pedobacter sp. SYP-B3415]